MALTDSSHFSFGTSALARVTNWAQSLLGHRDFSPEEALAETPGIDPRMIPHVKMSSENIDVHLLDELGKIGLKRGKLITAESHPELMQAWESLSHHAGLKKTPQFILTESKKINALTVTEEEVVVTTGLLKILDLRELMAVLGHELGHETSNHKQPRMIATGLLSGTGVVLGNMFAHRGGIGGQLQKHVTTDGWLKKAVTWKWGTEVKPVSVLGALVTMGVGGFIGSVAANQLTVRPTELEADQKGAVISGDPLALASALRKLEAHRGRNPVMNFFAHLQSGYPSEENRIHNLEEMARHMPPPVQQTLPPTVQLPAGPVPQVQGIITAERMGTDLAQTQAIG